MITTNKLYHYVITGLQTGNEKAFDRIFEYYYNELFIFAGKIIKNSQEAEDIVSGCFVQVWRNRKNFANERKLRSFLYTSTRNACFNYLKSRKRKEQHYKNYLLVTDTSGEWEMKEKQYAFEKITPDIFSRINAKSWDVFMMFYMKKMSVAEIADKFNVSERSIRRRRQDVLMELKCRMKHFSRSAALEICETILAGDNIS